MYEKEREAEINTWKGGGGDELALYMLYLPKIFNYFQVQVRLSMFWLKNMTTKKRKNWPSKGQRNPLYSERFPDKLRTFKRHKIKSDILCPLILL